MKINVKSSVWCQTHRGTHTVLVLLIPCHTFPSGPKGHGEYGNRERVKSVLVTGCGFPKEDLCPDYIAWQYK